VVGRRSLSRIARAIALIGLVLLIWAFWFEPSRLVVQQEHISLPLNLRGPLRIAILSDLHVGSPFNGIGNLQKIVDLTNSEKPDLICVLGDLVIQGVRGGTFVAPEPIANELRRLRAPSGVVAVLGNHDGWLDHDRVARALAASDIRVVEETAVRLDTSVGPIWMAGISDLWMGRHDITAALAATRDDGAPIVLMTHNPDVFPDVPTRVALTLAGHTHGGQVRLPFLGRPIVPSQFGERYAAGFVTEGGRHLYVATGIGTSILPVRFRVPPSIVVLTVEPSK
jgi:predicted MPP superfamily phosphohydrolase